MHMHRHSPKAITLRTDARHCYRRRTHQTCTHHCHNNSSRTTHLPAGCDIQRNRLSSPCRSKRCSCKSLVAKHQSDTSLSCKTLITKDIISLDSTDDEADKDESENLSNENSNMIIEKRNQSTQPRIVRKIRPTVQTQTTDNRQIHTTIQKTRTCNAHALRHRKMPPKNVDTIVLDSSSEDEETSVATVDAEEVVNNKQKSDKIDDTHTNAQSQQTQQQQAARARLQGVSMPLRCALIGSVAIKPIRKEKHCIPGEVSSTTSHDIIETERLNETPAAVTCSGNLLANNASAYENAREVGTVEILERRELHQPVVMAERCFQPGKLLLGIDYSDDENEEDVAQRSRGNVAAGSDVGADDDISNGCIISMVGGYSKVVEEATSSTEVFQRIQLLENRAAAEALTIVEPAPAVLAGLVERTPNVATVSEDAPTCSRYANSNAANASALKDDTQNEGTKATPQAVEPKNTKSLKISLKDFASANIIGKAKDTPEEVCNAPQSVAPAFISLAEPINEDEQQQNSDPSIKTQSLLPEAPITVNNEKQDASSKLTDNSVESDTAHISAEDDETAAIDQILADIDENLRESHEFNEKYMKVKNAARVKTHNVELNLSEVSANVQNELDLRNTAAHNVENNASASDCELFEDAAPTKSAVTHTNDENLLSVMCEPVPELTKSLDIDTSKDEEEEANIQAVVETKSAKIVENLSSNQYSDEVLCVNPGKVGKEVTAVDKQTLQITQNDINSEQTEEVITTVRAESASNDNVSKEISSELDAGCATKTTKSTQFGFEEKAEAMDGNTDTLKSNEEIEATQQFDKLNYEEKQELIDGAKKDSVQNSKEMEITQECAILKDICSDEVEISLSCQDNIQTSLNEESNELEKHQLSDEETNGTLEKDDLALMDSQENDIAATKSGEESSNSDLDEEDKNKAENADRFTEVMVEEHTDDIEDVDNVANLSMQAKEITDEMNADQEEGETLTTSINNDILEVGNTNVDKQFSDESQEYLNILTTDSNIELEDSAEAANNLDDEVKNLAKASIISKHENLNTTENTTKHQVELTLETNQAKECELGTETELTSRIVLDETKHAEQYDIDKTTAVSSVSRSTEIDDVERHTTSADAVNCFESEVKNILVRATTPKEVLEVLNSFVEDLENLPTGVTKADKESLTPIVEEKEMLLESPEMSELTATDNEQLTVITVPTANDVMESKKETEATLLPENVSIPITEEILSEDNESEMDEVEATDIECTQREHIECCDINKSASRLIDEDNSGTEIQLTKQKSDSSIEESCEMLEVQSSPLATKSNDNIERVKKGNMELVNDTKQYYDDIRETPLLESSTKPDLNENEAEETETTDIITIPQDVRSKVIECNEASDPALVANKNFDSSVEEEIETADAEPLPLTTEDPIKKSHAPTLLVPKKPEEITLDTIESVKDDTNGETEQTTIMESSTKFEESESEVDESEDIDKKSALDLTATEFPKISDSTPDNNGEQTVLATETQISESNLPESAYFSIDECTETADVAALPKAHEIVVPASSEIEELVKEDIIEELPQTEDEIETIRKTNDELVNNSVVDTGKTLENIDLEIISAEAAVVTDTLIVERENSCYDHVVEDKQLTEVVDSQIDLDAKASVEKVDEFDEEEAVNKSLDTFLENSTEYHEQQRCESRTVDEILPCEEETTDETQITIKNSDTVKAAEVNWASTIDGITKSSAICTEVIENLSDEETTKSEATNNVGAKSCSQEVARKERKQSTEIENKEVGEVENYQTQKSQEQEQLDTVNSEKTCADFTKNFKCSKSQEILLNTISDVTADQCALDNVWPTESFDQDSDQNANIPEEKQKEIVEVTEHEVKEVTEETQAKVNLSECYEFSTADVQVPETTSVPNLQVDEGKNDISAIMEQQVVALANNKKSVDLVLEKNVDSNVQTELVELAENEYDALKKCSSEESHLIVSNESVTSEIPDEKARNVEGVQVENELTAKFLYEDDEVEAIGTSTMDSEATTEIESGQIDVVKSTVITEDLGVTMTPVGETDLNATECDRETAVTNSLDQNDKSPIGIDAWLECATGNKSDTEIVKMRSRQKLKQKAKIHKTAAMEKSTTNSGKKLSKLKAIRNLKKRLLTEDAFSRIRIKRRVSPSNDSNKDLDSVDELKTAEELADNIAKLVIKENLEVAEDIAVPEHETEEATVQDEYNKQDVDSKSLEDPTDLIQNKTSDDVIESEQQILPTAPELSEDCTSFQRLPSEYNSEEILAVTTLINMRNKYASSTYINEDKVVVEMPQEMNRDGEADNMEATAEPSLKKTNTEEAIVKKKVRFDEDNLLELMNEKHKTLKKVKKSTKKIEKSRKAEGALLIGTFSGKKYVKRRLLELATVMSADETDCFADQAEPLPVLKKKRGRKSGAIKQEEQPLTHKLDELNEEFKSECAENYNPIYPVRLTSRRKSETTTETKLSKSIKNGRRGMKYDTPPISDVEDVGSDFIVPDDEVEPLGTENNEKPSESNEPILNVSRVCVEGTKIKFKITPKEAVDTETALEVEKEEERENTVDSAEKKASTEIIYPKPTLIKTRKVTVKLKRIQMPSYATDISKASTISGVQSATLTDTEERDPIIPVSPTKYKKGEKVDPIVTKSPTKHNKGEEIDPILPESPIKCKKGEELDSVLSKSPTKYKKSKLALDISTTESNTAKSAVQLDSPKSTNDAELFIATYSHQSSLGKPSHTKQREKSPYKNKKFVKRDISSELSELATTNDTAADDQTNLKDVSVKELSSVKKLSSETMSIENTQVVENVDTAKNQDASAKITVKLANKNRLAKSSSKTKSATLSTTGKDLSPTKEAPNKQPTTLQNAAIEKTSYNNEISDIKDLTNLQAASILELSPRKDALLAETSSNKETIAPSEQLEKIVANTKGSRTNATIKAARKNRLAKSSIKIKLPLSSLTTTKLYNNESKLNEEESAIKETIAETSSTLKTISKVEESAKVDTSIENEPLIKESTSTKERAIEETSPKKKLTTVSRKSSLARVEIVLNHEDVENTVANLPAEAQSTIPSTVKTTTMPKQTLLDAEIKTEPLDDIDIKEEEDSCQDPINIAESYLSNNNRGHAKEFILKPCDVILTEAKINEQADAHRGYRKQRNKKATRVVEKIVAEAAGSNRYKTRRNKAAKIEISKSTENIIETENVIPTLEECAQIKEIVVLSNEQKKTKNQKELEAEAEAINDDKDKNEDIESAETAVPLEEEIQQNATPSKADCVTEDNASSITDNIIAELKLLSPESLQNTEDDKEQMNLITCSESAAAVMDTEKEQETQSMTEAVCKVEKTDEEQKTAQLLDSSIDIVLGNATFTKIPLTSKKDEASSTPDALASKSPQNMDDAVAEAKKPDAISESTPTKNRLDVLTAEKINSVLEKMLENKNNLLRGDCKSKSPTDSNLQETTRRPTSTEEEGLRKSSNRSSMNSVKQISAKVPDALFADDESESSNADDSTSEQFFAPILSLDDLLIKKDEQIADITHTYTTTQEQVLKETDAGHSHDGLGTPNFAVELEVETTQGSEENSQNANANRKVETQSEETGKCVAGEELNTHLEETDANFSLSAIADISSIDIPNDLNINNEYPDLLDAMLFEQVRQSIDCMISGTNSAKKWSQDSFATTKAAVNFNQAEATVRSDVAPSAPIAQENNVIAIIDKTVTATEDAIGIGQETFLGTISSLDQVEVPPTGFDLVGSFTIADFLSEAGSDLFAFPELDKTQSRSNSFSAESNLCETPPPPAIGTADEETSNDKKDENSIESLGNHNTNSVACDHSYNKDINEVEKQRTKVRKKSTSSHQTSTPTASQKSATTSPSNNTDMLQIFSRSKCLPKPFWKVKKTEEMKTSTPKKEEPTTNTQITQEHTAVAAVKRTITLSPITVKNAEEQKQTVFSMPALELVIEQTVSDEKITAAPPNNIVPEAIANPTTTETLTNLNENISKTVDDITPATKPIAAATVAADALEKITPQELITVTKPPKRASTPIEITEMITIPAPIIVQPIIRIQSQTNRLERIDPVSSASQQAFPIKIPEGSPNLIDTPNISEIEINNISRQERDSTPTLDEPNKDEYELSSPNNLHRVQETSATLEEPPAKRLCLENVNKAITTNDIFDMLKSEEKLQKKKQCEQSSTNTTKTMDSASCKTIDSEPKQIETEIMATTVLDNANLHTISEVVVSDASNNCAIINSQTKNKSPRPYTQSVHSYNEKKASESTTSKQEQKPLEVQPTKQKDKKLSTNQEPILISKETLIALKKRENAAKNMSSITMTDNFQPFSPENTPEKCAKTITDSKPTAEKIKISLRQRLEDCQGEKSIPITLEKSKNLLSQPNQSNDCQESRNKPVQSKSTHSTAMPTTKYESTYESSAMSVKLTSDEHSSSARSSKAQSKKRQYSTTSPVLTHESPCARSNITVNLNKTNENAKANSQTGITEEEDVRNTPPVKSNLSIKIKDLPIAEAITKSETKNASPSQTSTISPRTRVPPKPILAVVPTLLPQNANRYHPYQKTQTPPHVQNTHKSKAMPQRQSRDSLSAAPEGILNKRKETLKSADKTTTQRIAPTATTLPPSMQSRPTPSHQSSYGTPPTITDLASIKLTAEEEADIARKLAAYRTTLPPAKTYGAHKENQRLVNLHEEKLRLEYAERANRRKAQQLRDTQRLKRKSQSESYQAHFKKFTKHSENPVIQNRSSGAGAVAVAVAANHQHRSKQHPQYIQHHSSRPRTHHEYVNKFGEIEKLVEKEKVAQDTEAKRSVPLTASTAWEPKMPTGDELIELFSKTKKS